MSDLVLVGNPDEATKRLYHSNNLFEEQEFRKGIFNKRYRYGIINPYQSLTNCREFLFFTKPDLHIYYRGEDGVPGSTIRDELRSYRYWTDLEEKYPDVLGCLQASKQITANEVGTGVIDPFNQLLANMVQSNIDVPGISAEMIETPSNMYGVNFQYRGSSEASDDGFEFSLEFKDTKYLPVYHFFKAYEEYERLKHHGIIGPWIGHIQNRVLHDQYCIYKFLVDEDMETIIYYAKYYGVKSKSLPRDTFNNVNFDNGLSYSVDFNAAFVEDMNPEILADFNRLSYPYWNTRKYDIDIYNEETDSASMVPAQSAIVTQERNGSSTCEIYGTGKTYEKSTKSLLNKAPGQTVFKLKWRGNDLPVSAEYQASVEQARQEQLRAEAAREAQKQSAIAQHTRAEETARRNTSIALERLERERQVEMERQAKARAEFENEQAIARERHRRYIEETDENGTVVYQESYWYDAKTGKRM
jgi:hypothetical protein